MPAISVRSVTKTFKLPHEQSNSLKEAIIKPWKLFGRKYSVQTALEDINIEINDGEFVGIVGRNGSGKSTLLKLLAGIYQPNEGSVQVNGRLMPFIELGVGFNPELTGRENVYLSGALLGFSEKEIHQRYNHIVKFAELDDFMDQKLKNYSSGMQVRLAFSIAIQSEADILLIDEVLAVGDSAFQQKCYDYFKELKKDKKTVVFVTHDMEAVREYCDRAILIDNSKVVMNDTPNRVAREYGSLFQSDDNSANTIVEGDSVRIGNKAVQFTKLTNQKSLNPKDKYLEISVVATASQAIDDVNFGFAIKDLADQYILGTNTRLLDKHVASMEKGQKITLTWKVPNVFHNGRHFIDIAATNMSESVKYDWWESASQFSVKRDYHTAYAVQPEMSVKVDVVKGKK